MAIETKSQPHFETEAVSQLEIAGLTIWDGKTSVRVDDTHFALKGDVHLLDDTWPIYAQASAKGTLSSDSFELTGEGKARFLVLDADCEVHLGTDGALLSVHCLHDEVVREFRITKSADGRFVEVEGKMRLFSLYEYDAGFS